jgi:hypothetical protein
MDLFDDTNFVALLSAAEVLIVANFKAAMSAKKMPEVRLTCKEAGFSDFSKTSEFKKDPIFKIFKKWFNFCLQNPAEPQHGTVTGDMWADFKRHCIKNPRNSSIYFVVEDKGGAEPVTGSLHENGLLTTQFLSCDVYPALRRIPAIRDDCMCVDLDCLMLSLQFPQLDDVPVIRHITKVTRNSISAVEYFSCGTAEYNVWPVVASFPSYDGTGTAVNKNLCVAQLIGLLQFPKVPRHPIKLCHLHAVKWGISKGKWRTTLIKKNIAKLRAKVSIVVLE